MKHAAGPGTAYPGPQAGPALPSPPEVLLSQSRSAEEFQGSETPVGPLTLTEVRRHTHTRAHTHAVWLCLPHRSEQRDTHTHAPQLCLPHRSEERDTHTHTHTQRGSASCTEVRRHTHAHTRSMALLPHRSEDRDTHTRAHTHTHAEWLCLLHRSEKRDTHAHTRTRSVALPPAYPLPDPRNPRLRAHRGSCSCLEFH